MVVNIKQPISKKAERAICQTGTLNGNLAIIITGEVKGIMESHTERLLSGLPITEAIRDMDMIIGSEIGNINWYISVWLSTAAAQAAKRELYNKYPPRK